MTARIRTHIDLNEVEADWMMPAATRHALVAATRALIALVDREGLERYHELEDLNEPWASAVLAVQPFKADHHGASDGPMPEGVTEVDPW